MPLSRKKLKGFTLIEMVTSIALFIIIMTGVIQIFGTSFNAYRQTRLLQHNLEIAQVAVNQMAKELRTSSVVASTTGGGNFSVTFFEYSGKNCIQYVASGATGKLTKYARPIGGTDPDLNRQDCQTNGATFLVGDLVSSGITSAASLVIPSVKNQTGVTMGHVGKITISLTFGGSLRPVTLQTTVSFRDFNYVGI